MSTTELNFIDKIKLSQHGVPDDYDSALKELIKAEDEYAEDYEPLPLERAVELYENDQLDDHIGRDGGGPRYAAAFRYCIKGETWEWMKGSEPETTEEAVSNVRAFFDQNIEALANERQDELDDDAFDAWARAVRLLSTILPQKQREEVDDQLPDDAGVLDTGSGTGMSSTNTAVVAGAAAGAAASSGACGGAAGGAAC